MSSSLPRQLKSKANQTAMTISFIRVPGQGKHSKGWQPKKTKNKKGKKK